MKKKACILICILFLFCLSLMFQKNKEIPTEVYKNITRDEYSKNLSKSKLQHNITFTDEDKYVQVNVKRKLASMDIPVDFIVSYITQETENGEIILKNSIVVEIVNPIVYKRDKYDFRDVVIYSAEEPSAVAFVMSTFYIIEKNKETAKAETLMIHGEMIKFRCKQEQEVM